MNRPAFLLWLPVLLVVSCAGGSDNETASEPARKKLSERINEEGGFKVDKNGNWVPRSDKRSSFESQGQTYDARKNFQTGEYKSGEYKKKSWWGNKEYDRLAYQGDTDGSRFQKSSRFQGEGARESGNAADIPRTYQTDGYATGAAREAGADPMAKPSDAETDIRRRVFQEPEVVDWRQQRALSIEQSRGILGR